MSFAGTVSTNVTDPPLHPEVTSYGPSKCQRLLDFTKMSNDKIFYVRPYIRPPKIRRFSALSRIIHKVIQWRALNIDRVALVISIIYRLIHSMCDLFLNPSQLITDIIGGENAGHQFRLRNGEAPGG